MRRFLARAFGLFLGVLALIALPVEPASATTATPPCAATACIDAHELLTGYPAAVAATTGFTGTAVLSVAAVARYLNLSEQTIRGWCRAGLLPARRPPGTRKWLIDRDAFTTWLHDGGDQVRAFMAAGPREERSDEAVLATDDTVGKGRTGRTSGENRSRPAPRHSKAK